MNKFSNLMWLLSKFTWQAALMGKGLVAPWKHMIERNKQDKLVDEIDKALGMRSEQPEVTELKKGDDK